MLHAACVLLPVLQMGPGVTSDVVTSFGPDLTAEVRHSSLLSLSKRLRQQTLAAEAEETVPDTVHRPIPALCRLCLPNHASASPPPPLLLQIVAHLGPATVAEIVASMGPTLVDELVREMGPEYTGVSRSRAGWRGGWVGEPLLSAKRQGEGPEHSRLPFGCVQDTVTQFVECKGRRVHCQTRRTWPCDGLAVVLQHDAAAWVGPCDNSSTSPDKCCSLLLDLCLPLPQPTLCAPLVLH